jgi:hypothetical protein
MTFEEAADVYAELQELMEVYGTVDVLPPFHCDFDRTNPDHCRQAAGFMRRVASALCPNDEAEALERIESWKMDTIAAIDKAGEKFIADALDPKGGDGK